MKGRVLIIAGSDPSGGAGVQADIKTVTALGGYAAAAITALTVQNTRGVSAVHAVPPAIIRDQIVAVLDDIGADAIKIGMIGEVGAAEAIASVLRRKGRGIPVVLDPVLVATSGDPLAGEGVAPFILKELLPLAFLVTPNADEAAALTGLAINGADDLRRAAEALRARGAGSALMKGGHLPGDEIADVLVTAKDRRVFSNARIGSELLHGAGCTLASAAATGLAHGMALSDAVERAIAYVRGAIRSSQGFGGGPRPLNHAWAVASTNQAREK